MLRILVIVLIVLASLLVAAAVLTVGVMAAVFAILPGQASAKAEIQVVLLDQYGVPMNNVEVQIWKYDYSSSYASTDQQGIAVFKDQHFSYQSGLLSGRSGRPDIFELRVRFPEQSDLYYRFEVSQDGPVDYHVFDDSYDYFFGEHWLGKFSGSEQIETVAYDASGSYQAKSLSEVAAPLLFWQAQAKIDRLQATPGDWSIRLNLREIGWRQ